MVPAKTPELPERFVAYVIDDVHMKFGRLRASVMRPSATSVGCDRPTVLRSLPPPGAAVWISPMIGRNCSTHCMGFDHIQLKPAPPIPALTWITIWRT